MCGIVAKLNYKKTSAVNEDIADLFDDQRNRGTEGFGFVGIDSEKHITVRRAREETKALADLYKKDYPAIVFHHRYPTSTPNYRGQTHPMRVSADNMEHDYLIVHNGVIKNAKELKKAHESIGFKYETVIEDSTKVYKAGGYKNGKWVTGDYTYETVEKFNDSEALAIEVALVIEGVKDEIEAAGSVAFIAVQTNKETGVVTNIFFGRNDTNPLRLLKDNGGITLSSEGDGDMIEPFVLHRVQPFQKNIEKTPLKFYVEPVVAPPKTAPTSTVIRPPVVVKTNSTNQSSMGFTPKTGSDKTQIQKIFDRIEDEEELPLSEYGLTEEEERAMAVQMYMELLDTDEMERMQLDDIFFEFEERFYDEIVSTFQLKIEAGLKEPKKYTGQDVKAQFARLVDSMIEEIITKSYGSAERLYTKT